MDYVNNSDGGGQSEITADKVAGFRHSAISLPTHKDLTLRA